MDAVTLRHVDKAYTSYSTEIVITGEQRQSRTRQVLKDLSVTFAAGQLTVIVGRSGCGKSTLLKLLAGKEQPDAGEISIPQGWHSAMLSPDPYVITWTNVQRNVAMACGVGKTPEERYEKVYCFDVMEKETGKYLPQDQVKEMVTELGLTYVPVFYDGPFVSWEAIEAMVGRTELGGAYGEGVVVKNMTRLNDPNEKLPFYTKIVGADFAEKKSISRTHMEQMSADAKRQALADSVVTEARVRKMILKLVDENLLSENWREEKPETISRQLTRQIYYDCVKEEPETVEQIGKQFGKYAAISTTNRVREMMKNQK